MLSAVSLASPTPCGELHAPRPSLAGLCTHVLEFGPRTRDRPIFRPKSANVGRHRPNFGQSRSKPRRRQPNFDRHRPKVCGPRFAQVDPTLSDAGPHLDEISGQVRAKSVQVWPTSVKIWSASVQVGSSTFPSLGRRRRRFGRIRSICGKSWSEFTNKCAKFDQHRQDVVGLGRNQANFGRLRARFGPKLPTSRPSSVNSVRIRSKSAHILPKSGQLAQGPPWWVKVGPNPARSRPKFALLSPGAASQTRDSMAGFDFDLPATLWGASCSQLCRWPLPSHAWHNSNPTPLGKARAGRSWTRTDSMASRSRCPIRRCCGSSRCFTNGKEATVLRRACAKMAADGARKLNPLGPCSPPGVARSVSVP